MKQVLLYLLMICFSNNTLSAIAGSFKSGTYSSYQNRLSCNLEGAIGNLDLDYLADHSSPDSDVLTFMTKHQDIYINYLVTFARKNSAEAFEVSQKSDSDELEQVIQSFTNAFFVGEQLLNIKVLSDKLLEAEQKPYRLLSHKVEFDNKAQIFSSAFKKVNDFYLVVSIMPTLVDNPEEIIVKRHIDNLAKQLIASCTAVPT